MSKNIEILNDFINYCEKHPQERFWQALRNWSGFSSILGQRNDSQYESAINTFYLEGKN